MIETEEEPTQGTPARPGVSRRHLSKLLAIAWALAGGLALLLGLWLV